LNINKLKLINFGPFYGEYQLDFKPGVNLIYGGNGSGKTCLFRAVKFGLFGDTDLDAAQMKDFQRLINYQHLKAGGKEACVEITFTLLGKKYTIERSILSNGVVKTNVIGQNEPKLDNIYQQLPSYTSQFFLFDGEEIRHKIMSLGSDRWNTAGVLGFNIFRGIMDDLASGKQYLSSTIAELEKRTGITHLHSEIEGINLELTKEEDSIRSISKKIEEIKLQLRICHEIKHFAEEYEKFQEKYKNTNREIKSLKKDIQRSWTNAKKAAVFAPYSMIKDNFMDALKLVEHMKELAFNARLEQGRFDSQIEILLEIDQNERCICGTELGGSKFGKKAILDLVGEIEIDMKKFDKAASAEFWPAITLMDMLSNVELADRKTLIMKQNLANVKNSRLQLDKIIDDQKIIKSRMKELQRKVKPFTTQVCLTKNNWSDVSRLNIKITKLEGEINNMYGRLDILKDLKKMKSKELKENMKKLESLLNQKKTQLDKLRSAYNRIEQLSEIIERSVNNAVMLVLKDLKIRFNEIFKKITNKPTEFIDVEFSSSEGTPQIKTRDGMALSMTEISDGEKQILLFALMSALKKLSPTETLVIDAPFGRLDSVHSDSITKYLPEMAEQSILMITDREFLEIDHHNLTASVWCINSKAGINKLELLK
jgi:DNA sulfur modification protein DndD